MKIFKGRRKIMSEHSPDDLRDVSILIDVIKNAMSVHDVNKGEIDYLIDYHNGNQSILYKQKAIRPEVNNKLVINHASMITRNITGYFLGTPIQYVQGGADKKKEIEDLNNFVQYEDKASVDKDIAEYQSICGTAYKIVFTDGLYGDDVPFEERALNPSNTFVVYRNDISELPILGVTYLDITDETGASIGKRYYAYCDFGVYEIQLDKDFNMINSDDMSFSPYSVGGIPIVEYPNNMWRTGDWENCLELMDSINALQSGRLDDIDQIVQSLLVFVNADIDKDLYDEMREAGVISLKNTTNSQTDVKQLIQSLDQNGLNLFADELEKLLYSIVGIPDRKDRASGGGDTGQAVELRDGWADLEIVARNKELNFKKSEKMSLKIILSILKNKLGIDLSLLDIGIKFSRNKNNNLLVKTQSLQNLLASKILDPSDCLTVVDLVSDVNDFTNRGMNFWEDNYANKTSNKGGVENGSQIEKIGNEETSPENKQESDPEKRDEKNVSSIKKE